MNRLLMALTGAVFGLACGGSTETPGNAAGGSVDDASSTVGAGGDSSTGTGGGSSTGGSSVGGSVVTDDAGSPIRESGIDLDAFPIPDGPIGACATCIRDMCQADLATCAADPKCQMGVICSIQNCAQYAQGEAGAAGLLCLTNCFGDLATALGALSGLTCVTTMCGSCTSLIDAGARD